MKRKTENRSRQLENTNNYVFDCTFGCVFYDVIKDYFFDDTMKV